MKVNESTLQAVIEACKRGPTGGGAVTKTVITDVTLYDKPKPPQTECYLKPNDKVTVLTGADIPQAFRNLEDKTWVPVKGASGACNGTIGGVYDDGKLR